MPYTPRSKKLPEYIKKLTPSTREKWVNVFNTVEAKEGEQVAFIVANSWLKRRLKSIATLGRTDNTVEKVTFVVDSSKELIQRTEKGEDFISFKLAEVGVDKLGQPWPEFMLKKWASQVNDGLTVVGDLDHKEMESLIKGNAPDELIEKKLREKPSIAKAIKAVFDNGKLWLKAVIDKRYKKLIQESKGVSLEAVVERDSNNNVIDGNLLGFTFGVDRDPVFDGTEVNIHAAS